MAESYPHKTHGYQVLYTVYLPNNEDKRKWRYAKKKSDAKELLKLAQELEYETKFNKMDSRKLLIYRRVKLINETEYEMLIADNGIDSTKPLHVGIQTICQSAPKITLGELKDKLLKKKKVELHPNTFKKQIYAFNHLIEFFGKETPPPNITENMINNYREQRLDEGIRHTRINDVVQLFAELLDLAMKKGIITENPARNIKKLRVVDKLPRALTQDEIDKLLGVASKSSYLDNLAYKFILTGLHTGMRPAELAHLEWNDIQWEKRHIIIQSKDDFITKTGNVRRVGLSKLLTKILKDISHRGRYVFGGQEPWSGRRMSKSFKKIARQAGLPEEIHLYCLRHTYITRLIEKRTDLRRVQELAGHTNPNMTWRYSHAMPTEEVFEDKLDFLDVGLEEAARTTLQSPKKIIRKAIKHEEELGRPTDE
jgi:integrase/recombinase XerD